MVTEPCTGISPLFTLLFGGTPGEEPGIVPLK